MAQPLSQTVLSVLDPHHSGLVLSGKPVVKRGYPVPGKQSPSGTSAMSKRCFVDENTWQLLAEHGEFDDIVVGSGFCALAYIQKAYERDPFRKILLLERGGFWLSDHFQNLPLPMQFVSQDVSETFPWEISEKTERAGHYLNGSSPFFGGRSSFWSIWCPRAIGPEDVPNSFDLMDNFPPFMKAIARDPVFYQDVESLLHVKTPEMINSELFKMQNWLSQHIPISAAHAQDYENANIAAPNLVPLPAPAPGAQGAALQNPPAPIVETANLATGVTVGKPTLDSYRHFSAVGSLLAINEHQNRLALERPERKGNPLMIATDVVVERFEVEDEEVDAPGRVARNLHTSRGPITLRSGKTNVILATGAVPATTILLNSIKDEMVDRAGTRLTAHFRSQIKAHFQPSEAWVRRYAAEVVSNIGAPDLILTRKPVMSAHHIRGRTTTNHQWHIQLTATYIPNDWLRGKISPDLDLQGLTPECEGALTSAQVRGSGDRVLMSCSVLGELPPDPNCWVKFNQGSKDVSTNVRLQLELSDQAKAIWDEMETNAFAVIEAIFTGQDQATGLRYWNDLTSAWVDTAPVMRQANGPCTHRVKPWFHEASTLYMTKSFDPVGNIPADPHASVDQTYRPHGLHQRGNVYVTGAALFPTAGSWNPTPTICGFAQHLAKTLVAEKKLAPEGSQLIHGATYQIVIAAEQTFRALRLQFILGAPEFLQVTCATVPLVPDDLQLWTLYRVDNRRWVLQNRRYQNYYLDIGANVGDRVRARSVSITPRQQDRTQLAPRWDIWWDGVVDPLRRRIFVDCARPTAIYIEPNQVDARVAGPLDHHENSLWDFRRVQV